MSIKLPRLGHLADLSVSQSSASREKRSISVAITMARAAKESLVNGSRIT
jgi:hypothetical protein